jgi:hypothetical protein
MKKARLITLATSLCLMAFYFQGAMRPVARGLEFLGCPGGLFDGHGGG